MIRTIGKIICAAGYWACMIYAADTYGLKAGAIVLLAGILIGIFMAITDAEEPESDYDFDARAIARGSNVSICEDGVQGVIAIMVACRGVLDKYGIDADRIMTTCKIDKCEEVPNGSDDH